MGAMGRWGLNLGVRFWDGRPKRYARKNKFLFYFLAGTVWGGSRPPRPAVFGRVYTVYTPAWTDQSRRSGSGPRVPADGIALAPDLHRERAGLLAERVGERKLGGAGQAGPLSPDPGIERIVRAQRQRARIERDPLPRREVGAALFDTPDPERGVLDVEVSPLLADARRPASVGRAVNALVEDRQRARVLDEAAAMPETALLVEPQAARLAQPLEQLGIHAAILVEDAHPPWGLPPRLSGCGCCAARPK